MDRRPQRADSRGTNTSSGSGASRSSWCKKPDDSGPSRANRPPSRTPAQARESHDGSSGTVKNSPRVSRRHAPDSTPTADAVAAQSVTESLIPRHHVSLHRCQLQQAVGYVLSSMHVLSVRSWPQIVRPAENLWTVRRLDDVCGHQSRNSGADCAATTRQKSPQL